MTNIIRVLAVLLLVAGFSVQAFAGDEGLYDKAPPEGSSFFRFITTTAAATPKLNGKALPSVQPESVSPYAVVPHGKIKVGFGAAATEYDAEAKGFYTVVENGGKLTVLKDAALADKLKAQIIVYNLTKAADVALKTADGKVSVVGPVASMASADRQVNAIKVSFAAFAGDKKLADFPDTVLEREQSYAIVVSGTADKPVAKLTKATIAAP